HAIAGTRLHRFSCDVGLDRQLASPAVHEHAQRDAFRPAEVGQLVERRAHGPARVEHVVHDHNVSVAEIAGNVRLTNHRFGTDGFEIVAIEGDVERAAPDPGGAALFLLDEFGDALGELDAAALN